MTGPVLPPREAFTEQVEFGNLEFPAGLRLLREVGALPQQAGLQPGAMQGTRNFVLETAEYVTSDEVYAQAFDLTSPLMLHQISLALQKFGGTRGELWLDLVRDQGGMPAGLLRESARLDITGMFAFFGYRWLIFDFQRPEPLLLEPGRYWIILRHGGDPIFNWFYTPGNAYGTPDDTRSRKAGDPRWDNILNYDFNFRVTGLEAKP